MNHNFIYLSVYIAQTFSNEKHFYRALTLCITFKSKVFLNCSIREGHVLPNGGEPTMSGPNTEPICGKDKLLLGDHPDQTPWAKGQECRCFACGNEYRLAFCHNSSAIDASLNTQVAKVTTPENMGSVVKTQFFTFSSLRET